MTDFNRVFIDSAPLIYFLENDANFGERAKDILTEILSKGKGLSTSVVTCEEFLVHPYQSNDAGRVQSLFDFLGVGLDLGCRNILGFSFDFLDRIRQFMSDRNEDEQRDQHGQHRDDEGIMHARVIHLEIVLTETRKVFSGTRIVL